MDGIGYGVYRQVVHLVGSANLGADDSGSIEGLRSSIGGEISFGSQTIETASANIGLAETYFSD